MFMRRTHLGYVDSLNDVLLLFEVFWGACFLPWLCSVRISLWHVCARECRCLVALCVRDAFRVFGSGLVACSLFLAAHLVFARPPYNPNTGLGMASDPTLSGEWGSLPADVLRLLVDLQSPNGVAALPLDYELVWRARQAVAARQALLRVDILRARSAEVALRGLLNRRVDGAAHSLPDSASSARPGSGDGRGSGGPSAAARGGGSSPPRALAAASAPLLLSSSPLTAGHGGREGQELALRVAASGLAGKLFLSAIPELDAMLQALDALVAAGVTDACFVTRAWLLLRGVRGYCGVRWLGAWLLDHLPLWTVSWGPAAVVELLRAFDECSREHHDGRIGWAGHNEGRHAGLSGSFFLRALATDHGMAGLTSAVTLVCPVVRRVLERDPSLSPDVWVEVAASLQGLLVLSAAGSVRRAGAYNSMDFARGLAAWAARSFGVLADEVSECLWDAMVERQQGARRVGDSRDYSIRTFFRLDPAAAANAFLVRLRAAARPLVPGAQRESVTWVGVLVFLCELRQVLSCRMIGMAGVCRVLSCREDVYTAALVRFDAVYRRSPSFSNQCHLVRLFLVAQLAIESFGDS